MNEQKKFAISAGEKYAPSVRLTSHGLIIGNVIVPVATSLHSDVERLATQINEAVDAEVERRLDEITRKAVG